MMNLEILKKYNIKPKKSLGQNFLVNDDVLNNIANIVNIEGENVIEVGPGYGALTEKLLKQKPKSLTLLELDKNMINILNSRINEKELDIKGVDFEIENVDVLKYTPKVENYFVIANIPYYITSPILRHFLYDVENRPQKMVILMQKDVGDRIMGGKGKVKSNGLCHSVLDTESLKSQQSNGKSSVLSLFVQKKCNVKEMLFVGKENFIPSPKVESSVLLFELYNLYDSIDDKIFLDFIKKGFREPRKKLLKNLTNSGYEKEKVLKVFEELGIDENVRGEDLGVGKWCELSGKL